MKHKIFMNILWLLPKDIAHKILYRKTFKRKLDLKNPITLNEKIHWMIVNYYGEKEGFLADKEKVKEYIASLKIKNLLIPKTYFKITNEEPNLNMDVLPEKFVMKTNHGSGDVFICLNKNKFDFNGSLKKLIQVKKYNFAKNLLEYHYSFIEPVIMIEEFLDDNINHQPLDYKFFCYDGYVDSVMVCSDRLNEDTRDFFDKNWNHLDYTRIEKRSKKVIEKPQNLELMFDIASEISKGFPFVRVDLYNINGKIYFGEMTFTPAAGLGINYNEDGNKHLGSFIDINKLKNETRK